MLLLLLLPIATRKTRRAGDVGYLTGRSQQIV